MRATGWLAMTARSPLPRRPALHRAFESLAKIRQLILGEVADRPVVQAAIAPVPDVESLHRLDFRGAAFCAAGLRHEQIDHVLAPAIDHGADGAGIDIIEPAADQGEALGGEVDYRRRDVELAVEPRFYRVLVSRDHLGLDALHVVIAQHDGDKPRGGDRRNRRAHRKAAQHRAPARYRARLRQGGLDAPAQLERSLVARATFGNHLAHRAIILQRGGASRAARDMVFDIARVAGVEFAVDQRVKQQFSLVAIHFGCSSSAIHAERSMARARARRDITVPTGTSATSAISRYERFWTSRSTKVSRNGSASVAISRRTVSESQRRRSCASGVSWTSCHSGACSALSGTSSIGLVGVVARLAYSARQTLRRIAKSHGFIAGPR